MSEKQPDALVQTRIPKKLALQLKKKAKASGLTVAAYLRQMILRAHADGRFE